MIVMLNAADTPRTPVLINPSQVRFVKEVGSVRHVVFHDQSTVVVSQSLEQVRTILNTGLR